MSKLLPLRTCFIDIETSPLLAYVWRTGKTHITIDSLLPDSMVKIICISWRWDGDKETHHVSWDSKQNDKKLLVDFLKAVEDAECLVGHNEKNFDIKIINARIAYHGLDKSLPITMLEDTLQLFRRTMNLPSMKLDYLLHYFGIKRKLKTDMGLWMRTCYYNDRMALEKMIKYCDRDVDSLYELYKKCRVYLPSQQSYAIVKADSRLCPHCGSTKLESKGYRYTALSKKKLWRCTKCRKSGTYGSNEINLTASYPR